MSDTVGDAPSEPTAEQVLAGVRAMSAGTLSERMGIEFVEASVERLVATMPVVGNTQPYGLMHGGASCVLAETLGSVGAALHGASLGRIAVGIEINATHHRAATHGSVTGVATPIQLGGSLASYEIVVTDEEGRRICTARLSCLLRAAPPSGGPTQRDDSGTVRPG